jgi:hypothetical protein
MGDRAGDTARFSPFCDESPSQPSKTALAEAITPDNPCGFSPLPFPTAMQRYEVLAKDRGIS